MLTAVRRGKYDLALSGHAGAGQRGRDLICAGASVLALTLEEALREQEARGRAKILELTLHSGAARFRAEPEPGQEEVLAVLFDTVTAGMTLLAVYAPAHITVRQEDL